MRKKTWSEARTFWHPSVIHWAACDLELFFFLNQISTCMLTHTTNTFSFWTGKGWKSFRFFDEFPGLDRVQDIHRHLDHFPAIWISWRQRDWRDFLGPQQNACGDNQNLWPFATNDCWVEITKSDDRNLCVETRMRFCWHLAGFQDVLMGRLQHKS